MDEFNNLSVNSSPVDAQKPNTGKNRKIIMSIFALLIIGAAGFAYKYYSEFWVSKDVFGEVPEAGSDELVYKNLKYGYSFVYPTGWRVIAESEDVASADTIWLIKDSADESEAAAGGSETEEVKPTTEEFSMPTDYIASVRVEDMSLLLESDPEFKIPENAKLWVKWQKDNQSDFSEIEGKYSEKRIVVSGIPSVQSTFGTETVWVSFLGPYSNYAYRLVSQGADEYTNFERLLSSFTFVKDIGLR